MLQKHIAILDVSKLRLHGRISGSRLWELSWLQVRAGSRVRTQGFDVRLLNSWGV